jgi:hypothetical protein
MSNRLLTFNGQFKQIEDSKNLGFARTDLFLKIENNVVSAVPAIEDNSDYQLLIEWLADNNTILPFDE